MRKASPAASQDPAAGGLDGIVRAEDDKTEPPTGRGAKRHSRDGDGAGPGRAGRLRRLMWVGAAMLTLSTAAAGAVLYANNYYADKAAPGVLLAGRDVGGMTAAQVTDEVNNLVGDLRLTLTQAGESVQATATQLGVAVDAAEVTREALAQSKDRPLWERLNPLTTKPVVVPPTIDRAKLTAFLDQTFIGADETTRDASVAYDSAAGSFKVEPAVTGLKTDPTPVIQAIEAYLRGSTTTPAVAIPTKADPPAIGDDAAAAAAAQAEEALTRTITFSNGLDGYQARGYQLPAEMIAGWTVFTPHPDTGELTVSYDTDLIAEQLTPILAEQVAIPARKQITYVYPGTTKPIGISQWGLNGYKMADPTAAIEQVAAALAAGEDAAVVVPLDADPFAKETVEPPSNYDEPDGAAWVDVNRTDFTATLYRGTTKIATYVISIGKPSTPTPTGEFYVYLKYEDQVMRGPASDPYESATQWVSYFTGGVAFHSAPWNEPNKWQMGVSHGCVNMKTKDAKAVFDFAPIGTKVVVHD
ncbi:MAG: L,D-transpeptidase/peptidoglycan binding protein [Bifidobacteriaceae bacterium]|jgi:lipoprotein-anchoring transpeptidase ErfK/SrfK|nr:L,D-transpeptidase/peptidoglycan binding protein [Bifidobacteriaceae bacterium]